MKYLPMNFLFLKYLNFLVLIEFKINIHDSTAPAQIIIFFENHSNTYVELFAISSDIALSSK